MRYFTHPRCAPEGRWDDGLLPSLSVSDHVPTDTGLVDHRGDKIMRGPNELGFHNPKARS